jgi:polyadenylation factor subunit 2
VLPPWGTSLASMATSIPVLLPSSSIPRAPSHPHLEWTPKRHVSDPQPPPLDDARVLEQEMAAARQIQDGKAVKKTRPRRTVDFNACTGTWNLVRSKHCCQIQYV